jgi:hypothetical protein
LKPFSVIAQQFQFPFQPQEKKCYESTAKHSKYFFEHRSNDSRAFSSLREWKKIKPNQKSQTGMKNLDQTKGSNCSKPFKTLQKLIKTVQNRIKPN